MVEIVSFKPEYAAFFKELNYQWIDEYFQIEDIDKQILEDPEGYIVSKGGDVLFALENNVLLGTCALIKINGKKYELAKMAVDKKARGKKIGSLLGKAIIKRAKELGGSKLVLETNDKLAPALNLYRKLGFTEISGKSSPYVRCNVQMELNLE